MRSLKFLSSTTIYITKFRNCSQASATATTALFLSIRSSASNFGIPRILFCIWPLWEAALISDLAFLILGLTLEFATPTVDWHRRTTWEIHRFFLKFKFRYLFFLKIKFSSFCNCPLRSRWEFASFSYRKGTEASSSALDSGHGVLISDVFEPVTIRVEENQPSALNSFEFFFLIPVNLPLL